MYVIPKAYVIAAESSSLLCSSTPRDNVQDTETGFEKDVF